MPQYYPPDYIDNTTVERRLVTVLNELLVNVGQDELDIASGFFEPEVWRMLADGLRGLKRFRLLLGRAPELDSTDPAEGALDLRRYYRDKLRGDLEKLPLNREYARLIDDLCAFLERDSAEVRFYARSFLHAKAYLMPNFAIVGSSNFTPSGMTRRAELNITRQEGPVVRDLRENWYAGMWSEGEDQKRLLIDMLRDSKFDGARWTPHDVFIKVLYEYFKDRILPESIEARLGVELASFQQEGLREAIRLIDRHGGVIVSDAVGLGKTYIGMGLLEHYVLGKRRKGFIPKGLVICPAQLRELIWEPKLNEYGIKADVISQESLGRANFDWKAFNGYDVILVDESHNFRNPGTGRYGNLMKLLATGKPEKTVILMTATPINNSIWDLYNQLSFITRGQDAFFRDYGIRNLKGFFREVQDGGLDIFTLLEQVMVRRSRQDVKQRQAAGEEIRLPGKGVIHFPERRLHSVNYDLMTTYDGFYEQIATLIDSLHLISFNIEQHRKGDRDAESKKKLQSSEAIIAILKTLYLKRLESSLTAFRMSIEKQREYQERFYQILISQNRLLDSAANRKLLAIEGAEDDSSENVATLIDTLEEVEIGQYDLRKIRRELERDIEALDAILDKVNLIQRLDDESKRDTKLSEVKALLGGELANRKVLLFSYYRDTAQYVYDALRNDPHWQSKWSRAPIIEVIHGGSDGANRESLVRRFAPIANKGAEETVQSVLSNQPEIDILISTDVLSEGQNLQDAGVIVNFDLHWTPIRMIQRAGRIDRLGTQFAELDIYNCFPQQGLESLLGLVERLQERIRAIDTTVGLDASVLGEVIGTRSLDQLRKLRAGDSSFVEELERDAELVSTDEMKLPLTIFLQQVGLERVRAIPKGIGSGIAKSPRPSGVFFAFIAGDRHFWRLYTNEGEIISDKRRLFRYLLTPMNEKRVLPSGFEVYDLLERATDDVLKEINSAVRARSIPPRLGRLNNDLAASINQTGLFSAPIDTPEGQAGLDALRKRVTDTLQTVSLDPFRKDTHLKAIQASNREQQDTLTLIRALDEFFIENDLYREVARPSTFEQVKAEELELIAYEVFG